MMGEISGRLEVMIDALRDPRYRDIASLDAD